jgi:hypothetical protein
VAALGSNVPAFGMENRRSACYKTGSKQGWPKVAKLSLIDAADEFACFEEPAFITGGGDVSLGKAFSSRPNAGSFRRMRASGTIRNFKLRDVVLDADNLVLLKDGKLISDTCYFVPDEPMPDLRLGPDVITELASDEVGIVACNLRHHHYGHWMMQCLPSIDWSVRFRDAKNIRLITRALDPWQEDTLNLLGYGSIPRLVLRPGMQYRLPRAEYSQFMNGSQPTICRHASLPPEHGLRMQSYPRRLLTELYTSLPLALSTAT